MATAGFCRRSLLSSKRRWQKLLPRQRAKAKYCSSNFCLSPAIQQWIAGFLFINLDKNKGVFDSVRDYKSLTELTNFLVVLPLYYHLMKTARQNLVLANDVVLDI